MPHHEQVSEGMYDKNIKKTYNPWESKNLPQLPSEFQNTEYPGISHLVSTESDASTLGLISFLLPEVTICGWWLKLHAPDFFALASLPKGKIIPKL